MSKIAEIFNMTPHETEVIEASSIVPAQPISAQVEDDDFDFARKNQYELINQGKAAVNTAMRIAAESENPRAIEVLATLFKEVSGMNKQLVTLNKDLADVKVAKTGKGNGNAPAQQIGTQQNILFTGNGSDLNKLLAEKLKAST